MARVVPDCIFVGALNARRVFHAQDGPVPNKGRWTILDMPFPGEAPLHSIGLLSRAKAELKDRPWATVEGAHLESGSLHA
jgi:hypothetical protein